MATANFGVEHRKWQPVKFEMRLNSVGGLLARQSEPVISSLHGPSNTHFIKLVKTQRWLQRLVTGTKCNHALNETTLLEDLIQKVINGDCSVVAGIPDATDDDALLASLDYDTPVVAAPVAKKPKIEKNSIVTVTMPELCPTASVRGGGSTRSVKLWYLGSRVVWLAKDDVEWAVSYMRVQLDTCGVPPVIESDDAADVHDDDEPPPPAVRWDFFRCGWKVGTDIIRPYSVTIHDTDLDDAAFSSLTYAQKKEVAYTKACRLLHV